MLATFGPYSMMDSSLGSRILIPRFSQVNHAAFCGTGACALEGNCQLADTS